MPQLGFMMLGGETIEDCEVCEEKESCPGYRLLQLDSCRSCRFVTSCPEPMRIVSELSAMMPPENEQ